MTMMVKKRFGVNIMIFVFLLSLYDVVSVDVSDASYSPLGFSDRPTLEADLIKLVDTAKSQGQYFYVGVAKQYVKDGKAGTSIESLCERQGAVVVPGNPPRCSRSHHHADDKAATRTDPAKLTTVYYTGTIIDEPLVCQTEKNLVEKYREKDKKKQKDSPCLNVDEGHEACCIQSRKGIVYLRIYTKLPKQPKTMRMNPQGHYVALAVDVPGVSYIPLDANNNLEAELIDKINEAKDQDQYFYVGVASKHGSPIESVCYLQGSTKVWGQNGCSGSNHEADKKAAKECGATLIKVFYADSIIDEPLVCGTEKKLIEQYREDESCLNVNAGHDCCIPSYTGIVFLRIYQKLPQQPTMNQNYKNEL